MQTAGFNLTKWASNSKAVMNCTDPDKRVSSPLVEFDSNDPLKALGVTWDTTTDCFRFTVAPGILASHDPSTKRSLLSLASKVFDPMGLISPYTIRAKILFQDLWRRGLEWDDPLDSDIATQWSAWKSELSQLRSVIIARCFGPGINSDQKGEISSHLVMSRSRVAPIKTVSLPRLELLAAVVNTRLLKFVVETLPMKVDRVVCWTDSMVTLCWIRRQSSYWKPFVANRVAEIQSTWEPECWKYCASKDNPADLLTRGISCENMITSTMWWNGPSWLSLSPNSWPNQRRDDSSESCEEEKRIVHSCTAVVAEPFMDPLRYGTWLRLVRVTAYVLRALKLFKRKPRPQITELSAEELKCAELLWHQRIQQEVYSEDYQLLKDKEPVSTSSRLSKLDPYFDNVDKVIRVGGRLQYSNLPEESKHPIILPHGHPVVAKIVQDKHKQMLHAGPETILATLRQTIWLTQGRRDVKRIIRKCLTCQRQRAKPCMQKMGPLPKERVSPSVPFAHVGIDFAGPLYVKGETDATKAYVCVFTCASSRMVHLELTKDLSTDEFLQALNRMTSRRGLCETIWSDNAKTFKAASREIKSMYKGLEQEKIQAELSLRGMKWKFITERAPWRGGWWERVVRAVKEPLRKILGKALLSFTELNTLIIKIEGIINSRPLTTVSDDHRDLSPITPAHLAIGRSLQNLPEVKEEELEKSSRRIMDRYLYLQRLLSQFWKRWRNEYLHQLTVRTKWHKQEPPIQTGDIVLISEDNVSRGKWPLAKVEEVHPGRDGLIRTVTVRTQRGTLNRPVQRLHRLEIEVEAPNSGEKSKFDSIAKKQHLNVKHHSLNVVPSGHSGEDVQAHRSRSGRAIVAPKRLDL